MTLPLIPLAFAVVGVLIYALSTTDTKLAEIGRLLFFAGILALAFALAGKGLHIG